MGAQMIESKAKTTGGFGDPEVAPQPSPKIDRDTHGQVVLVFQGGGALGAYQAGVYQALSEEGIEPDWVIGTSIGAINAALIAGNPPEKRLPRMREFWRRVRHGPLTDFTSSLPMMSSFAAAMAVTRGLKNFFEPNPWAFLSDRAPLGAEVAGYYSTRPLERTLSDLIDVDLMNAGAPRLTVGAANVSTAEMRYFDSRKEPLSVRHVLASGALPPAFPAVRIDDELYWDGGILSNTPVEAVFDDNPRRSGVVFAVHMWRPHGPEPDTINRVISRQKDLQYASRAASHILRQKQIHKLRHIISELVAGLPEEARNSERVRKLASYGCLHRMHVVRLLAEPLASDNHLKDIDFSPDGIRQRWDAGYADTARILAQQPWTHEVDATEGFILHEAAAGRMIHES